MQVSRVFGKKDAESNIKDGENMKLKSIKVGMNYADVRRNIIKSENLIICNLPAITIEQKMMRIAEIQAILENNLYADEKEKHELIADKEELEFQIELSKEM